MKIMYAKYTDYDKVYKRLTEKELAKKFEKTDYLVQIDKIKNDTIYFSEFHPYDFI